MTARRVGAEVAQATIQGDEHPFLRSGGNHVTVGSSGQALRGDGVHVVAGLGQETRGRDRQFLVKLELHWACGSGSSSSRASAAP